MNDFIYVSVVFLVGLALWVWFWRILGKTEAKRAKRLQQVKRFEPIRTSAPETDQTTSARVKALENLGVRFSILRRTLLIALLIVWFVFLVLPFLERIPTTMVSLLGAGGAILLGIAARPLLENVIAGYVVTFSKQFRIGDTILVDKEYGTIEDITPTHTVVKLWDWRRYILPNSAMLNKEIINYNNRDSYLWAKLEFHVNYDADIDFVRDTAIEEARRNPHFAGEEDPSFWIMRMDKETIHCWLAMWTHTPADAWAIRVEVAERLIKAFQKKGIKTHTFYLHPEKDTCARSESST